MEVLEADTYLLLLAVLMERRMNSPHSEDRERRRERASPPPFYPKNGCCRLCMKAFSISGKSCLCQVPTRDRTAELNPNGCKICGCHGCSPQDRPLRERERSESSSPGEHVDMSTFDNVNQSLLGKVVIVEYNMEPAMLGLGVPQRTPSYILGRPL